MKRRHAYDNGMHLSRRCSAELGPSPTYNRDLEQRLRRRQRERKKAIGLDWQNNNFARASRFFVHFFAVAARLQRESA